MTLAGFKEVMENIASAYEELSLSAAMDVALNTYKLMVPSYEGSLDEDDIELAVRRAFDVRP